MNLKHIVKGYTDYHILQINKKVEVVYVTNLYEFKSDDRFKKLSANLVSLVEKLDTVLHNKGYLYKGEWRNDEEPGGKVFIFEVERRKGRRKNLITLRPQQSFLRVEVYWRQDDKHYFDLYSADDLSDKLLDEIDKMYNIIAL